MSIIYYNKKFPTRDYIRDGKHDGAGCSEPDTLVIYRGCDINMSEYKLSEMDEAMGITWGASAIIDHCVIRGAGKLVLCGCGDADKRQQESGKKVYFRNSILEKFGRRGPEVQNDMVCEMEGCLIIDWGDPDRFTVRNFGAWAHKGGIIRARNCIFLNNSKPTTYQKIADHINHFFQAIKDNRLKAIFDSQTYVAGIRRGLTASDTGYVEAHHCFGFPDTIIQNHTDPMPFDEFCERLMELVAARQNIIDNARY